VSLNHATKLGVPPLTALKSGERRPGFDQTASPLCGRLDEAYRYHFSVSGGRSRESLALDASRKLELFPDDASLVALSVGLLHNASLIQDDMQDGASHRRGQPTVESVFGRDIATGLVNLLISEAFAALAQTSNLQNLPALIRKLQSAVETSVRGQTAELDNAGNPQLFRWEDRLSCARGKSGALFALCLELPLIMRAKSEYLETASSAALDFGLAYQIIDDLKDFDEDVESKPGVNLLEALLSSFDRQEAVSRARNEASSRLEAAAKNCQKLPQGCGEFLCTLIRKLEPQLKAFDG